jgi:hypothetical protein
MLRVPQHERKIFNDTKSPPFATSIDSVQALSFACREQSRRVEGLQESFWQLARTSGPAFTAQN